MRPSVTGLVKLWGHHFLFENCLVTSFGSSQVEAVVASAILCKKLLYEVYLYGREWNTQQTSMTYEMPSLCDKWPIPPSSTFYNITWPWLWQRCWNNPHQETVPFLFRHWQCLEMSVVVTSQGSRLPQVGATTESSIGGFNSITKSAQQWFRGQGAPEESEQGT